MISPGMSWYINLIRGLAAITVLIDHARIGFFSQGFLLGPRISHEMVIIFFVLSGFLTSNALDRSSVSLQSFFVARFSRISSVAYPALLLTITCDFIGRILNPNLYEIVARPESYWVRILLNFCFLAESGPYAASPGSNDPFWYLNYQVWFYILLCIWVFAANPRRRAFLLLIAAVLAGPKILVLFPTFFAGVMAYALATRIKLPITISFLLTALTYVLLALIVTGNASSWGYPSYLQIRPPLFWSTQYRSDIVLGFIIAGNILAFDQLIKYTPMNKLPKLLTAPTDYISDRSFSLYAFHMPLLFLASVSIPYDKSNVVHVFLVILSVVVVVLVLYEFTENKRNYWRAASQNTLNGILNIMKD
jgi:peptidoglycan/LPS O-acetylase OafA/YrhL